MRRTQAMAVLVGLTGALLLVIAPAASAQTGYPPGPCTPVTGTQDVGEVNIGQRFVVQLAPICLFTAGAPVTVAVNGVDIPGKVAETNGTVLVDVTVVSATQLSIDDPVLTPAICGTNTVTARGPSRTAQGGFSTQTATFRLNCPTGPGVAPPATPIPGRLSLTGSNTIRFIAVALTLLVAGAMAVTVTRRRRGDSTVS